MDFTPKDLMMKTINFIIILFILFTSCSQSKFKLDIQGEYEKLARIKDREIVVNKIHLLKSTSMNFGQLAKFEIHRMRGINELREQELEAIEKLDSLIREAINRRKCLLGNANSEYKEKYLKKIDSDSMELKNNHEEQLKLKIGIMEDKIKILKILELSKLDSIQTSENLSVKHIIELNLEGEIIVDTLKYIMFNNGNYNYLNENLFLEN